jgi:hypothetical protein
MKTPIFVCLLLITIVAFGGPSASNQQESNTLATKLERIKSKEAVQVIILYFPEDEETEIGFNVRLLEEGYRCKTIIRGFQELELRRELQLIS